VAAAAAEAAAAAAAAEAAVAADAALALAAEAALALVAEAAELAGELPAEAAVRHGELAAGARAERLPIALANAGLTAGFDKAIRPMHARLWPWFPKQRDSDDVRRRVSGHSIPACRIDAVTLEPAMLLAISTSLRAAILRR
jgi:hypothetical protein